MSDQMRRWFNCVEAWLDRTSIRTSSHTRTSLSLPPHDVTATTAFAPILQAVQKLDRQARLTLIAAPNGIIDDERANCWEFFFDLPKRRAKVEGRWLRPFDDDNDDFGLPVMEIIVRPFPGEEGALMQLALDGKILYRQLNALWLQDMESRKGIEHDFMDDDVESLIQVPDC